MKKVLAIMLTVCMVLAFVPAISFAADTTINAVRTAFFNSSGSEWKLTDNTTGNDNVLVSAGATGWEGATSFTDSDGAVTTQTSLNGTPFGSARHALVSFTIPADFDADNVAKVTLGLTVKNVKQTTSGARLSVYGNSVAGTWSTSNATSTFGVSGSNSGLTSLTLLGLTDAIVAGHQNDEVASGETITLSSKKLTEYVCQMAKEGKTEVTFRLACTLGGIRIYDANTSTPPTLTIEEGKVASVNIKTVYMNGDEEVSSSSTQVTNVLAGSTYTYSGAPVYAVEVNGGIYTYSAEDSTLSTQVAEDGTSEIVLVYNKFDESQIFEGYEVDDEGAWCWFADPRSISYANDEGTLDFSILGYIDVHGSIKATQINHLTDEVNEVLIRSNIQPDDHNNPTFLVLPDERIIVFYSRHTDENCFWYRVTKEKGDLTTLGEEKCLNTKDPTTYPSPFLMENDPDHIYLMWRGINWHPTIAKLSLPDEDGNTAFTYGPYQMVQSTAARPYAKYASNGVDKLYVTYTLGHPDNEANNWVFFNQIDIATMTLQDVKGNTMSTIANGALNVNASNTAQTHIVDAVSMRDWVWQVAEGSDGNPVIAMVRINSSRNNHDYYYAKWNGTEWVKTFLANGGASFHQSTGSGLELSYSGGMAIDPENTNIMYCSVPVEGVFGKVYEIIKFTMSDDGTQVVATEQITKNSKKNNVRPFVLPNSEGKDIRLIWMHGDYYDWIVSNAYTTQGYCTAVMAENPLPAKNVNLDDAVVSEDYASIGGAFQATKETANIVEAQLDGDFTVSADIYLEGDYEGQIMDLGTVQVSVKNMSTQYGATATGDRARVVVTVDGVNYATSNVYGSSDCWVNFNRGTGGNYGVENYQGYINHTVTYDGEYLTLYREGLVDIKIPVENVTLENVQVGGFDGLAKNVNVYDRILNHDEIKALAATDDAVETPDAAGDITITKQYVDIDGSVIETIEETLPAGTEYYQFVPEEELRTDAAVYAIDYYYGGENVNEFIAVYHKTVAYGENLVSGFDALTNALNGGALNWSVVDKSTLDPSLEGQYIHLTGASEGGTAAKTMRTFIPIEGGKTYYVSNTIYNNTGATTTNQGTAGMSAIIAAGNPVYGSFAGLTLYSDIDNGGVTSWFADNSDVTFIGTPSARNDIVTVPGENKVEYIVNTPAEAKTIMLSYGAWGNEKLYYGDFVVREVIDVETVNVTVDGEEVMTYGTLALGEDGQLPENVIGYNVVSADDTAKFVGAGDLQVSDGDVITTANINIEMITGAQVRYGGGLNDEGKVAAGNGLRFIAQVDRSSVGEEVTGYGVKVMPEDSDKSVEIAAEKWQDADETIFTAALTDLATSNYNRKFTAAPYVTVKYSDETEATIYGTNTITRSIYQVAAGLLKNADSDAVDGGDADYDTTSYGLYDVLNAYVNMVGIRLTMDGDNFTARTEDTGAYSGDVFFDVATEKVADGVYNVTVTPLASFNSKVTIMSYWNEFVRINNNHTKVAANITDSVINEDGSVTFTFTVPEEE